MGALWSRRTRVPDHVLVRELQGESVILNLNDERYVGLDAVATHMWKVLGDAASIGAAYDSLFDHYDVAPERLRVELEDFVTRLRERQLIELVDPESCTTGPLGLSA